MRLIIVDGLDAVGKDTHGKFIADYFKKRGEVVILRSHPATDNYFGRKAKQALFQHGRKGKLKASIFYMFDVLRSIRRYYHPKRQGTLIMVRYLMGTAYLPKKIVKIGYSFFEHFVPTSKYMIFLDAPPDELMKRVQKRDKIEIFETLDALGNVRNKALLLTKNWHVIDTSGTISETQRQITSLLETIQ
jgi:dTMP kinase